MDFGDEEFINLKENEQLEFQNFNENNSKNDLKEIEILKNVSNVLNQKYLKESDFESLIKSKVSRLSEIHHDLSNEFLSSLLQVHKWNYDKV